MFPSSLNFSGIQKRIISPLWVIRLAIGCSTNSCVYLTDRCRFSEPVSLRSTELTLKTRCRQLQMYHQCFVVAVQILVSSECTPPYTFSTSDWKSFSIDNYANVRHLWPEPTSPWIIFGCGTGSCNCRLREIQPSPTTTSWNQIMFAVLRIHKEDWHEYHWVPSSGMCRHALQLHVSYPSMTTPSILVHFSLLFTLLVLKVSENVLHIAYPTH